MQEENTLNKRTSMNNINMTNNLKMNIINEEHSDNNDMIYINKDYENYVEQKDNIIEHENEVNNNQYQYLEYNMGIANLREIN